MLVLAQAIFLGSFLDGQYNARMLHSVGAKANTVLSVAQVIVLWFVSRSGAPTRGHNDDGRLWYRGLAAVHCEAQSHT
jgi:hypothetical protein